MKNYNDNDGNDYSGVKSPVVKRMLKNWQLSSEAEADNRKRGLNALKFRAGGKYQWEDKIYDMRQESNSPCETYNRIPQFTHQITNDMRQNMAGVKIVAASDEFVDKAAYREDIIRNIQISSDAEVAYDCAAESQVTIGWGYWRYITEYENEKSWDQIVKILWVPNTFTVYDDPRCLEPDRLDRKFLIQVMDVDCEDHKQAYGKDYDLNTLKSIGDSCPGWATSTTIREAEYWERTEEKSKLYRLYDGTITDEKPILGIQFQERDVIKYKVMWYKCNAMEVLEEREWPGVYIPYVWLSGEALNIDGNWQYSGVVEGMIPAQKQYNYWNNAANEVVLTAPKAPWVLDPNQIKGYENIWDTANVKNWPYLPHRTYSDGVQYSTPQRSVTGVDINAMVGLIQQAEQNFYAVTGIYPASLGQASNEKSGKAIMARQREGDTATFHFIDNMSRAQRAGGRILNDLVTKVYDGSRIVLGMKEDRTPTRIPINQVSYDPMTGAENVDADMTDGVYDVAVTTGASATTKRQESAEMMTQLIQSSPDMLSVFGDLWIKAMDWPGAQEISERLKRTVPPQILGEDEKGQGIPPEIQQQLEQSAQVIQQLSAELEQMKLQDQSNQEENQIKAADIASKIQIEQIKAQVELEKLGLEQEKLYLEREKIQLEAALMVRESDENSMNNEYDNNMLTNYSENGIY